MPGTDDTTKQPVNHWTDYNQTNTNSSQFSGLNIFNKGNEAEAEAMWKFLQENNRLPTEDEFKALSPENRSAKGYTAAYKNVKNSVENAAKEAGMDVLGIQPGANAEQGTSFLDEFKNFDNPNTLGGGLYEMYKQAGEQQYMQGTQELQRSERDLGMNQAADRQRLIEDIRNRRRTALKTGLSSAQIANQEVQSLLMAQNQSSDNAMQFYNQRMGLRNQFAMNDVNARMGTYETLGGGLGSNFGAAMAAGAGDANQVALNYGKNVSINPQHDKWFNTALGDKN